MLTVGSLFTGIGGFDLGLERTGMRIEWQCESDPFCQRLLNHHWPSIPCHPDITTATADELEPVDVLCGGFPCQDISLAGRAAGITGTRSGLWGQYARLVDELRPGYVIVENVPALLGRGMGQVLGDLAEIGYDAEWDCLPAAAFGAPHLRDRVWIVAYPQGGSRRTRLREEGARIGRRRSGDGGSPVADTDGAGPQGHWGEHELSEAVGQLHAGWSGWWAVEPEVGRVADGVPRRVDRLTSLGNALLPQIAEWLGRRILECEEGAVTV